MSKTDMGVIAAQHDEIMRLRAERDRLRKALTEADAETEMWASSSRQDEQRAITAEAERDRLREALEPFAALQVPKRVYSDSGKYSIFHDDIGRARAALGVGQ